jgi:hypothetical protein
MAALSRRQESVRHGPRWSIRHGAGFDFLKGCAEILAMLLNQANVGLKRFAVESFTFGYLLGALRERFRQVTTR